MKGKGKDSYPTAVVRKVNGQTVLDDPELRGVTAGVGKAQCKGTFEANLDRVEHFKNRFKALGLTADEFVIVILNVDDLHGGPLAYRLMPNADWQSVRSLGQTPFARGLVNRKCVQEYLGLFDPTAAEKLRAMQNLAVVVIDYEVAEIFEA
jgi:hypothetical protein